MTWAITRDGYKAEWIDAVAPIGPYVRVTGPGIADAMEFATGGAVQDACDMMHCCITYSMAMLAGTPVRQTLTIIKGDK